MKKFFSEMGIAMVYVITGLICVNIVFSILGNSVFRDQWLFSTGSTTHLGVTETVDDESIKTQTIIPKFEIREIILDYNSYFDEREFLTTGDPLKKLDAYVMINGVKNDLSNFVSVNEDDVNSLNTTISGTHTVKYSLDWNGYHIEKDVVFHVLEDPSYPGGSIDINNQIRGSLVDMSGNPISARLQLVASGGDSAALILSSQSSRGGIFNFYGVKPNTDYEIFIVGHEGTPISSFHYESGSYNLGRIIALNH